VITHGSAGDAFWDVVQNGAEGAGEDLGVSVDYQSDNDPQRQAQLVDAAINQGVDRSRAAVLGGLGGAGQ
jgi:simple sugar transport system substrate-binding protein